MLWEKEQITRFLRLLTPNYADFLHENYAARVPAWSPDIVDNFASQYTTYNYVG
jgi:hypothetical protein